MPSVPHPSNHVYPHGLAYLFAYALSHPEHSSQWVGAILTILAREGV